ncbi:MAG TPA: MFS transporter [Actinomycetota bacterium]|nr:MFS transporter [Actinomycetota bacterium]
MNAVKRGLALILKKPDFRNLMSAQFLAQAGDGIVQTALAKLIVFGGQRGFDLEGADSPQELLSIALYLFVPYTILSPFLGVLIDRWDRRRLLFLANGFRAVVILIVGLVTVDRLPEGVVFLAFLLTLTSTRIVLATKAAAIPATVGAGSLVDANAVSQLGGALFQIGGAGVALIASGVVDAEPIAIVGALVYGAGAVFGLLVRHAGEARPKSTFAHEIVRVAATIADGFKEVARTPKAGAAITTYFWLRLLWSFSIVSIGFVARDLLGDDDTTILVLTGGAGALGAVLGFVLAPRLVEKVRTTGTLVIGASVVAGAGILVFGAIERNIALAIMTFFLGFGFFLAKITLDSMVQEALGDDFRGRAFSLYDIAYNLAWVIAAAALKAFYSEDIQGLLIAAMGAVFLVGVAGLAAWYRNAGLLTAPAHRNVR